MRPRSVGLPQVIHKTVKNAHSQNHSAYIGANNSLPAVLPGSRWSHPSYYIKKCYDNVNTPTVWMNKGHVYCFWVLLGKGVK